MILRVGRTVVYALAKQLNKGWDQKAVEIASSPESLSMAADDFADAMQNCPPSNRKIASSYIYNSLLQNKIWEPRGSVTVAYVTDRRAKLRLHKKLASFRMGLTAMHYQLSFLDETGCVRDRRESDFEADSTALLWMRIVGAERALDLGWSMMELCSRRRCVARVPVLGELGNPIGITGGPPDDSLTRVQLQLQLYIVLRPGFETSGCACLGGQG
jgi:hypothetical protein